MLGVRWPVISVTVSDLVRVDRPYAWRRYRLNCPRCGSTSTLVNTKYAGIAVDLCERCRGIWLDDHELSLLEAKAESTEDDREGTLIFAERVSDLECPVCNSGMRAFDYRASSLELNSCSDMHGYWLDAKESNKISGIWNGLLRGSGVFGVSAANNGVKALFDQSSYFKAS